MGASMTWLRAAAFIAFVLLAPWARAAPSPGNDDCLSCHDDATLTASDGRAIAVPAKTFADSVHGPLACTYCHADLAQA
jgi:hypothetical protein